MFHNYAIYDCFFYWFSQSALLISYSTLTTLLYCFTQQRATTQNNENVCAAPQKGQSKKSKLKNNSSNLTGLGQNIFFQAEQSTSLRRKSVIKDQEEVDMAAYQSMNYLNDQDNLDYMTNGDRTLKPASQRVLGDISSSVLNRQPNNSKVLNVGMNQPKGLAHEKLALISSKAAASNKVTSQLYD